MTRRLCLAIAAAAASGGCGYRVAGKSDLLPAAIRTIAIPAFHNTTTRYRLTSYLPGAIGREFLMRTRYRLEPDPLEADAVLNGAVVNFFTYPTVFDPVTGRAAGVQLSVSLQVQLTERATGKLLFRRPNLEFRQQYEIATDQIAYFEESDAALERLSREVARAVVSAVLENF